MMFEGRLAVKTYIIDGDKVKIKPKQCTGDIRRRFDEHRQRQLIDDCLRDGTV